MDTRQGFAGVQNASKPSHSQHYQQTMGVAALTPPSMPDSPPAQIPLEIMQDYPARFSRHLQPTPPPENSQTAQQPFLPLDGSRDDDSSENFQARPRSHHSMSPAATARQHHQLSQSPPSTLERRPALAATHPAQYQPPTTRTPEDHRLPVSPSMYPKDVRAARAMMPPPPPRTLYTHHTPPTSNFPPSSKADWSANIDPSLRTHYGLPKWEHPIAITRADCSIIHGNVTSPTVMIGLPFGSTIELANRYR